MHWGHCTFKEHKGGDKLSAAPRSKKEAIMFSLAHKMMLHICLSQLNCSLPNSILNTSVHTAFVLIKIITEQSGVRPISSGSGTDSGSWAATSCFKVATLYPPGVTSPGIISGKWKVDLGWSTIFNDRCQSEEVISNFWRCTANRKRLQSTAIVTTQSFMWVSERKTLS